MIGTQIFLDFYLDFYVWRNSLNFQKGHYKITPNENWNYDLVQLMSSLYDDYSTYELEYYIA